MNPSQNWLPVPQCGSRESTAYDDALLIAARVGSHAAFAEVQRIHSRRLYNRIRSITGNHEDAEALRLGVSLAAIKARLHRARKHLFRSQASRKRDTRDAGIPEFTHRSRKSAHNALLVDTKASTAR